MTESALLVALQLDGHGGASPIPGQQLPSSPSREGTHWLHLDYSQPDAADLLDSLEGLPPQVRDSLLTDDARPRSEIMGHGLFLVLRGVNTNPGADPDDMVAIRIWLEPGRIISTRRRHLKSILDIRTALAEGTGPICPGSFLTVLVDRLGHRASLVIADLEEQIDDIETRLEGDPRHTPALRNDLSNLRRQAAVLRRHLAPQRDALERLCREASPLLTDALKLRLRDEADIFRRYVEELDLARERAMVAHEHLQSLLAEQQNQRMFLLSVVAAIFLPLGFVTGLLGMNVGGIPGEGKPEAFGILLLIMTATVVGLIALFRWRRWF